MNLTREACETCAIATEKRIAELESERGTALDRIVDLKVAIFDRDNELSAWNAADDDGYQEMKQRITTLEVGCGDLKTRLAQLYEIYKKDRDAYERINEQLEEEIVALTTERDAVKADAIVLAGEVRRLDLYITPEQRKFGEAESGRKSAVREVLRRYE